LNRVLRHTTIPPSYGLIKSPEEGRMLLQILSTLYKPLAHGRDGKIH
jgi:hypothetical protein